MNPEFNFSLTDKQLESIRPDVSQAVAKHVITHMENHGMYYKPLEVADMLKISTKTLSRMPIKSSPINGGKIRLYRWSDVVEYLESVKER